MKSTGHNGKNSLYWGIKLYIPNKIIYIFVSFVPERLNRLVDHLSTRKTSKFD